MASSSPSLASISSDPRPRLLVGVLLVCGLSVNAFSRWGAAPSTGSPQTDLTPSQVVQIFYELSAKGEFEEAAKYGTGFDGFVKMPPMAKEDAEYAESIFRHSEAIRRIESELVKNDRAEVVAEVTSKDWPTRRVMHFVYKDQGSWKILLITKARRPDDPVCKRMPDLCHFIKD